MIIVTKEKLMRKVEEDFLSMVTLSFVTILHCKFQYVIKRRTIRENKESNRVGESPYLGVVAL